MSKRGPNISSQRTAPCRLAAELGSFGAGMRVRLKTAALITCAVFLLPVIANPCSRISFAPTDVPEDTVAFSGVVAGYPTAQGQVLGSSNVIGLRVTVVEALLASSVGSTFVIYLFGSAPDCSPIPRSEVDLREQYPLGSTVTIIADRPTSPSSPVLVTAADNWGHVGSVIGSPARTSGGFLDFQAFQSTYEEESYSSFSMPAAWRDAKREWFEDFEYLRCLIALRRPAAPSEKAAILQNVAFYRRFGAPLLYRVLVANVHLPASLEESLIRQQAERQERITLSDRIAGQSVGPVIAIDDSAISINGSPISLPASEASVLAAVGEPYETDPPAGDEFSNWVFRWKHLGLEAYSNPVSRHVHALQLLITRPGYWKGALFAGELWIDGNLLCPNDRIAELARLGFADDQGKPSIRRGCFYITIDRFYEEPAEGIEIGNSVENPMVRGRRWHDRPDPCVAPK